MLLSIRSAFLAVLSAFLLCFAAAPAQAATQLLSVGHGSFLSSDQTSEIEFSYVVAQHNGQVQGIGVFRGATSTVVFRVDSAMVLSDGETLAFAGVVLQVTGTPDLPFTVGGTVFTGFKDNGPGCTDETLSLGLVPPQFGNLTIQQIVGLIGEPPPQAYRPLSSGDVWIR